MTEVKYAGPSACTMLTILFIGLKLTNNIDWSWWWVLAPIWLPFTAFLAVLLVILSVLAIAAVISGAFTK